VVLLLAVLGGVAAAVLVLTRPDEPRRIFKEALALQERLDPGRLVHLRPSLRFPHVSLAERRRFDREPKNEAPRPKTRAAPPQVDFIESTSAPATVAKPAAGAADFDLLQSGHFVHANADLVAEPTVAAHHGRILATWNWGAALSSDGGESFTFLNPAHAFPTAHDGFCCDQVAHYVAARDLWIWLLQYSSDARGNVLRLAVARGESAFDTGRLNASTLRFVDISPKNLGWPRKAWFDFNGVASTKKNLFVATNVVNADSYEGVVIRIPLAELAKTKITRKGLRFFKTVPLATPRLVQGATDTMYFASHADSSSLRVWSWADGERRVGHVDVKHSAYSHPLRYTCERQGSPATADWCEGFRDRQYKNDDSILAGWLAKGRIGFAWNAAQDSRHGFAYPFVMAVEVDAGTMKRADEPIIWSPDYAYQYAAVAPNAGGELGGVALHGGGTEYETCTALLRDPESSSGWRAYSVDVADADPPKPMTGDYLGVSSVGAPNHEWAATCPTPRTGADVSIGYFAFRAAR
jgi:hypothetical protein